MKLSCREQAKLALDAAFDFFQHTKTTPSWRPKFIDLKSWMPKPLLKFNARRTIKSYPGYTVAKKLGIDLEIKHGYRDCGCMGRYSFTYIIPENALTQRCIMLRVLNMETWLHELCHAVSCELDVDRFFELCEIRNPNLILETEATLGSASLLALWQPAGYESELRHCFIGALRMMQRKISAIYLSFAKKCATTLRNK